MAEKFFPILKTECIYRHKPASFCEANEMIDRYINFYSYERIQLKTGVAPLTMRQREVAESLGLEGDRPIRKWVTDISYIPTKGFLYCPHNLGRFKMSRTFSVLFMPFSFCPGPAAAAPCSTNHGN